MGLGTALLAWAQSPKAGLYEVTSKMTWQQSPFPAGMQAPPGSGGPHSAQVCVTQAQIEKYNGPKPEAHGGCQVGNIQKHESGMTAEITCGAPMTGKGTVQTRWIDSGHSKSKVHFTGSMQRWALTPKPSSGRSNPNPPTKDPTAAPSSRWPTNPPGAIGEAQRHAICSLIRRRVHNLNQISLPRSAIAAVRRGRLARNDPENRGIEGYE